MNGFASTVVTLIIAGGLLTAGGCSRKEIGKSAESRPVVKGITLESVQTGSIPEVIEAVGTVKARNSSLLAARIAATVTGVHVREGDKVAKGKLLVTLAAAEAIAGAAGAQAGAEEAIRGVEEARSRKKLAEDTFERYKNLFREQAVTRQEFENRQTEKDLAVQGMARAEARLAQAREAAKSAATIAGYTKVTSPLAGVITSKPVEVGMTVFPGMPLMTVEEEGNYRLEVSAPESLFGKVNVGDPARFSIDGIGADMNGRVAEVVPTIDPASRTFTVKIDIAAKTVRSGIYGRVFFPVGTRAGLFVRQSSLVERGSLTSVWVVGKDNTARMRLVKAGQIMGERIEILSGLSVGDRIVITGVEKVSDGAKVE